MRVHIRHEDELSYKERKYLVCPVCGTKYSKEKTFRAKLPAGHANTANARRAVLRQLRATALDWNPDPVCSKHTPDPRLP
jgi:hypothetical protein